MPWPNRTITALLLGFLLLVAAIGASIWLSARQDQSVAQITHTLEVQNRLGTILSRLQDAETGQRGYLLTGDPRFLEPYEAAVREIPQDLQILKAQLADNAAQSARLDRLRRVAEQRQTYLQQAIARYRRNGEINISGLALGKRIMDEARVRIAEMRAAENALLRQREAVAERLRIAIGIALASTTVIVLLLGVYAIRTARRQLHDAMTTRDALAHSNAQLREEAQNRQAAEAQLRQVQKMEAVGQLTGGIAHDFNNMLAVVVGSLDMARRRLGFACDPRVIQNIDNAMEGAQRATQLTARLLAFSRQQPLEPQAVDANKLVGGMSELLRRTIGDAVRVETVLAGGLWTSLADPNQLENAILNLCVNARDAMPDGGKLTIETSNAHLDDSYAASHSEVSAGQYVAILVTDTGVGMPHEVVDRAFEPFFTTKGVGRGTGLGLSQVFGFIKQSRGHVKIYSEPGEGTTVKLYLPRHYGEAESAYPARMATEQPDLPRARDGEIILVVEDEERVRHVSVDSLRELGYTVVQASDANQALTALAIQPRIDLLFTDVVMPDMNGRKLAEVALAEKPSLKILYTTGYTRNAIVHNGVLDAGVALLSKPFTISQLAYKVRQVLDDADVPS